MYVLGVWDGHDSGAALIEDNKILFAANEERYTKRKLEIQFPYNAINAALSYAGIKPADIHDIAFSTTEFAKTVSRVFPFQMEKYYKLRRRKLSNSGFEGLMYRTRGFQYRLKYAENLVGVLPLGNMLSKAVVARHLRHLGFRNFKLHVVNHHAAHAASAAFASGFKKALVVTVDGYGDGLCSTISLLNKGKLERKHEIKARDSVGILYEQVTNLVGMRELEDEGKVMAMADYSFPFAFEKNKLKDFIAVNGIDMSAKYGPVAQYGKLEAISWSTPREQLAYFAQQLLENTLTKYIGNAIERFGIHDIAFAGGVFSNVKANMEVRNMKSVRNWFVFPHMGDGGIALGSAMYANYALNGVSSYDFKNVYFGNSYSDNEIKTVLKTEKHIEFERDSNKGSHAADLIASDNYVFWFQDRMEYGPRALGNRSIIAKADSEHVKDRLNLYVKQREWYQPFAPSVLKEDARKLFDSVKGYDSFMTMAYKVKEDKASEMKSVMHVDMTARPHIVSDQNSGYRDVLERIRKKQGYGIVLNTSFNIHGMPIVLSPEDAINTMKATRTKYMFLGNFYVENKNA